MRGIVTRYFADRAFGFIRPDDSRGDVFFHRSAMVGGSVPAVDMVVEFVEEIDPRSGRTRAANVRPI
jgi:CspA family cold shock protein